MLSAKPEMKIMICGAEKEDGLQNRNKMGVTKTKL
jgi:hypothetical protein